jgi:hypothetical protein
MTTSLRGRLGELAASFATSVLDAVRGASLDDLLSEASSSRARSGGPARGRISVAEEVGAAGPAVRRRRGRLARRSATQIANVVERIVALLRQSPRGLRAEQIRDKLGLQSKELPRPLKEALDAGRIAKSGQRRATTYFVKGAGPAKAETGKAAKKGTSGRRPRKASRKPARKPRSRVAAKPSRARSRKKPRRAAKRSRPAARRGKKSSTSRARAVGKRKKVAADAGATAQQPVDAVSSAQSAPPVPSS